MLRSLHSSSSSDTDNNSGGCKNNGGGGGEAAAAVEGGGDQRAVAAAAPSTRDLLLACADLLQRGDLPAARRAAEIVLAAAASPRGDAADRLAYHFARALALRVDAKAGHGHVVVGGGAARPASSGAYLAFNQIAPFLRFAHLTANQAILEAVDGARRVHILDLDAVHGVQWPPLLQAIAERADPALGPPEVRVTGAGADRDTLLRTGNRLRAFARSIHLPFHFTPLLLSCATTAPHHVAGTSTGAAAAASTAAAATGLEFHPDETLAVNCVMFLHNLAGHDELAARRRRRRRPHRRPAAAGRGGHGSLLGGVRGAGGDGAAGEPGAPRRGAGGAGPGDRGRGGALRRPVVARHRAVGRRRPRRGVRGAAAQRVRRVAGAAAAPAALPVGGLPRAGGARRLLPRVADAPAALRLSVAAVVVVAGDEDDDGDGGGDHGLGFAKLD
ncbi:Os06g0610350 [Oryza sativa Japonica Group]|nr:Os06g0610350 [Oryza sativa Japonica Group]